MMVERKFILLILVLLLKVDWSSGLTCYQCISCEMPFNASSSKVTICTGRSCFNYKLIEQDKYTETNKGCLQTGSGHGFSCHTKTLNGYGMTNCTCLSDLCNSATVFKLHFLLFPVILGKFIFNEL